jgi:hypothetical protein
MSKFLWLLNVSVISNKTLGPVIKFSGVYQKVPYHIGGSVANLGQVY